MRTRILYHLNGNVIQSRYVKLRMDFLEIPQFDHAFRTGLVHKAYCSTVETSFLHHPSVHQKF